MSGHVNATCDLVAEDIYITGDLYFRGLRWGGPLEPTPVPSPVPILSPTPAPSAPSPGPTMGEVVVFNDDANCAVFHSFSDAILDLTIGEIRVVRVDNTEHTFAISPPNTLRYLVVTQPWVGPIGETDMYKHLAGTGTQMDNLYLFDDHDVTNTNLPVSCPTAGTGYGRQTSVCPGTPKGLVSMGAHNLATLWGDGGECNYQVDKTYVIREMYVTPSH